MTDGNEWVSDNGPSIYWYFIHGPFLDPGFLLSPPPPVMSIVEEKTSRKCPSVEAVVVTPAIEDEEFFPDGGLRAWLAVAGCFVINAVIIGFW